MFVMSMVPICLSLFRFTNYSYNHQYSIALVCSTETSLKILKSSKKSLKRTPAVGVMQMQKLRSFCCEHRAVKVFPLKLGVGQNTAMHACCPEFLACPNFLLVHSPTLLFSTAYILNCISCG